MVSVLFVPKTGGSVLQKRLQELEPGLSAISGERVRYLERTGVTMKQLLHRNNPWAGAPCYRAASCLSCASDKDNKDNCGKRSVVYKVHCAVCRSQEEDLDYIYVGHTSESCYVRGAEHLDAMKARLRDEPNKSYMATHVINTHGGVATEAKFVMKKIKSYPSSFLRILAECIRIKTDQEKKELWSSTQRLGILACIHCRDCQYRAMIRRSSILCHRGEKPVPIVQIS